MKKAGWTQIEIDFLVNNYILKGATYTSEILNRTINSVKSKAIKIGLIRYSQKKWTEEEILFLKENYELKGCGYIVEILKRHRGSVSAKAKQLNLKVTKKKLFTKEELELAVKKSYCITNLLENLNKTQSGSSVKIIKKYLALYNIDISHFNPYKKNIEVLKNIPHLPLSYWLQEGTKIGSSNLKEKLYKSGIKERICEKCGQTEMWNGERISLILDHINGHPKDNRIENLRIVCPNCEATLETHCRGYKLKLNWKEPEKPKFTAKEDDFKKTIKKSPHERKVIRPPYEQLIREIKDNGYCATGRQYGVSDNAIRKWVKYYEKE